MASFDIVEYTYLIYLSVSLTQQYVRDKLKAMSRQIYRTLIEEEGHIYICGDVAMAEDVNRTLKAILLENDQAANVEVVFEQLKVGQSHFLTNNYLLTICYALTGK